MTKIAEINAPNSLQTWLIETEQSQQACVWLAHRAALRVLPHYWHWVAASVPEQKLDLTANTILRSTLTSGVAAVCPTPEVKVAARSAADTAATAASAARSTAASAARSAATAARSASASAAARSAASAARSASAFSASAARSAAAFSASAARSASASRSAVWKTIQQDAKTLTIPRDTAVPHGVPLYHDASAAFDHNWADLTQLLEQDPDTDWSFWSDWYTRALSGTEDRWDLLERIALSDLPRDETDPKPKDYAPFWKGTDADINARINAIWDDWKAQRKAIDPSDDAVLETAVTRTYNAEVIEFDDDTQNWTAIPVTELDSVFPEEAIQDIEDLVDRLDAAQADGRNPLPITAELNMLRKARHLIKSPRRLFGLCKRVMQRIDAKVANGDCPAISKDADLMDLFSTLTDVRLSMQKRDPEVAKTHVLLEGTPEISSTDEAAIAISEAAEALAPHTDGEMPEEFVEDAYILTDPNATPEMRRDALHQSSGRILRIWRWVISTENWEKAEKKTKPMAATVKNVTIIAGGLLSPAWLPTAIQHILKLFGS